MCFEESEAVGKTCKILQGPDTSREALRALHAALRTRTTLTVRLLNYTKQGAAFLNDLTVKPLRDESDESGGVTHFVGTLCAWRQPDAPSRDPLAFETPDEQLSSRDIRHKVPTRLLDALGAVDMPLVITEGSQPFRITHVNKTWCELCGYTADEAIGRTNSILQGPGTCANTLQSLKTAALTRQSITVKLVNYTKARAHAIFSHPRLAPPRRFASAA